MRGVAEAAAAATTAHATPCCTCMCSDRCGWPCCRRARPRWARSARPARRARRPAARRLLQLRWRRRRPRCARGRRRRRSAPSPPPPPPLPMTRMGAAPARSPTTTTTSHRWVLLRGAAPPLQVPLLSLCAGCRRHGCRCCRARVPCRPTASPSCACAPPRPPQATSYAIQQPGESWDAPPFACATGPDKPMMELNAGSRVYYQVGAGGRRVWRYTPQAAVRGAAVRVLQASAAPAPRYGSPRCVALPCPPPQASIIRESKTEIRVIFPGAPLCWLLAQNTLRRALVCRLPWRRLYLRRTTCLRLLRRRSRASPRCLFPAICPQRPRRCRSGWSGWTSAAAASGGGAWSRGTGATSRGRVSRVCWHLRGIQSVHRLCVCVVAEVCCIPQPALTAARLPGLAWRRPQMAGGSPRACSTAAWRAASSGAAAGAHAAAPAAPRARAAPSRARVGGGPAAAPRAVPDVPTVWLFVRQAAHLPIHPHLPSLQRRATSRSCRRASGGRQQTRPPRRARAA